MKKKYIIKLLFIIGSFFLYSLILTSVLYNNFINKDAVYFLLGGICRVTFMILVIWLILKEKTIQTSYLFKNWIICILIVIPIIYFSLSNTLKTFSELKLEGTNTLHSIFIFRNLSVGMLEELMFRVLIFSYSFKIFSNKQNNAFKQFIFTSVSFGLFHIINLNSPGDVALFGVFNQIFMAMIIGIIFQFLLLRLENIAFIAIIHAFLNYNGDKNSLFGIEQTQIIESGNINYLKLLVLPSIFLFIVTPITYFSLKNQEIKLIKSNS